MELYFGFSQPCGDTSEDYSVRANVIEDIYTNGECTYNRSGSPYHPDFYPTGFQISEYTVLSQNNILPSLKEKVPNFTPSDL